MFLTNQHREVPAADDFCSIQSARSIPIQLLSRPIFDAPQKPDALMTDGWHGGRGLSVGHLLRGRGRFR